MSICPLVTAAESAVTVRPWNGRRPTRASNSATQNEN